MTSTDVLAFLASFTLGMIWGFLLVAPLTSKISGLPTTRGDWVSFKVGLVVFALHMAALVAWARLT